MLDLLKRTLGQLLGQPYCSLSMSIIEGEGGGSGEGDGGNPGDFEGEGQGDGDGDNEPVNWEERATKAEKDYGELKSHSDRQYNETQGQLERYKTLLAPYQKHIVENEDGSMDFRFDDPKGNKTDVLEMPTDDEFIDNPKAAAQRVAEIAVNAALTKRDEKNATARTQREAERAEAIEQAEYEKARGSGWKEMIKQYPQLMKDGENNTKDRLFLEADKILRDNPMMKASGNCDKLAVELAARRLGIQSVGSGRSGKDDKKSYLIGGGGGGKDGSGGELSDEEFFKLPSDKRLAYIRAQAK